MICQTQEKGARNAGTAASRVLHGRELCVHWTALPARCAAGGGERGVYHPVSYTHLEGVESLAAELGGHGADKVYVCESPLLATYTTDAYAKVICDVIEDLKPEAFLIGATNIGRDLGPRCAARLHTGLCADCTHLDVDVPNYIQFLRESSTLDVDAQKWDMEDRNLKLTRPAFGGHLMATIICPRFRPCMATVRPGVMKKAPFDQAKACLLYTSWCLSGPAMPTNTATAPFTGKSAPST